MKAEYLDHMGTDLSVVNAARVSFDKRSEFVLPEDVRIGDLPWITPKKTLLYLKAADVRLIRYLARGYTTEEWEGLIYEAETYVSDLPEILKEVSRKAQHFNPFTHTAVQLRLEMPIAIARQFTKHNVGFTVNEVSRRYVSSTPTYDVPVFRQTAKNVKQGSGEVHEGYFRLQSEYITYVEAAIRKYEEWIAEGVCPEQARFVLPQGVNTTMIVTANVYAWSRFFNQRTDSHAQKEHQDLAWEVSKLVQPLFPVSWEALTK